MIGPGSLGSLHTDLVILVASNSQHTLYLQIYHNLNTPETSNVIEYSVLSLDRWSQAGVLLCRAPVAPV